MLRNVWLALTATALLSACGSSSARSDLADAGTDAVGSRDGALIYVPRAERDAVAVLDAKSGRQVAQVSVGKAPAQVSVGTDDTLYVANRGSRSVSVIRRGDWREAARVEVGVEPSALQVSADNRTLYVVNSTSLEDADVGTLMAVDVESLQVRWSVEVGPEPRGLTLDPGERVATVHLLEEGQVVRVDLRRVEIVHRGRASVAPPEASDVTPAPHARG